jgi:hypothetical protein
MNDSTSENELIPCTLAAMRNWHWSEGERIVTSSIFVFLFFCFSVSPKNWNEFVQRHSTLAQNSCSFNVWGLRDCWYGKIAWLRMCRYHSVRSRFTIPMMQFCVDFLFKCGTHKSFLCFLSDFCYSGGKRRHEIFFFSLSLRVFEGGAFVCFYPNNKIITNNWHMIFVLCFCVRVCVCVDNKQQITNCWKTQCAADLCAKHHQNAFDHRNYSMMAMNN